MILITGVTGFIGRRLLEVLMLEQTGPVRCLVRSESKKGQIQSGGNAEFVYGDLLVPATLDAALKDVDLLIHLAGGGNCRNRKEMARINAGGTRNIINACRENGVKRIIFLSSFNTNLVKKNYYARSKYEAEQLIINSGMEWVIMRPALVYGANGTGTVSQYMHTLQHHSLLLIAGTGRYQIQPVYVDDLVQAIIKAIKGFTGYKMRIYDILGPEKISYIQLAHKIAGLLNKNAVVITIPYILTKVTTDVLALFLSKFQIFTDKLISYPFDKTGDIHSLENEFGIMPKSLEMGIQELLSR